MITASEAKQLLTKDVCIDEFLQQIDREIKSAAVYADHCSIEIGVYPYGAATNTENKIITELQTLGYAVSVLFSVVRHKKAYITFKISW